MTWEALSALSSAIGTVVVVAAAWVGLRQWKNRLRPACFRQLQRLSNSSNLLP
jgi:uncharacterized membrane protein YccC